jgi:hypothetical protein
MDFGSSAYDLSVEESEGAALFSRLEFPQASFNAGVGIGISMYQGETPKWFAGGEFVHSVFGMGSKMEDYDGVQLSGYPVILFMDTYSDNSTTAWRVSAEAGWYFYSKENFSIAVLGTYQFQSVSHVEDTVLGWQYKYDDGTGTYTLREVYDSSDDVLEYTLTSHTIGLGFLAGLRLFGSVNLELRACYTPVYVSDQDDHKLRTKLSTASGWGSGLSTDLKAIYEFSSGPGVTQYVALEGRLVYYVVNTTQTQYWYGSADSGAPQGTTLTGVGHIITNTQYGVGLRFGVRF